MQSKKVGKILLYYHLEDEETAGIIESACEKAIHLARDSWGLPAPGDCRIYLMTSWWEFVIQSAPWHWRLLLLSSIPFWIGRVRRTWPYSAGWTQRYGRRIAIGVKPPRLLERSQTSIGLRIFVKEEDPSSRMQHVACHELVHACSAHLGLPLWLNEGIATVSVDAFLDRSTILRETLDLLRGYAPKAPPPTYRQVSRMGLEAIAYHGVRGYWLVRYLEEVAPGLIRRLLSGHKNAAQIEYEVAAAFDMDPGMFWSRVDGMVADHFQSQEN